jgi:tRNA threonylcarbamoyladenosine biosynthesis protein TsaE
MLEAYHFDALDESAMVIWAQRLAGCLTAPLLLTFQGEIGAGKTTFIRAMLRALGVTGAIKSPTFSLVESYASSDLQLHHFDLYRIEDEVELDYLGFRDFLSPDAICCIEWPEKTSFCLGLADIQCVLQVVPAGRRLTVKALTDTGKKVLACVMK